MRDFTAIGRMVEFPLLLVTHPSLAANSVPEFIALAKAKPGVLTYSSPGIGNGSHLAGQHPRRQRCWPATCYSL